MMGVSTNSYKRCLGVSLFLALCSLIISYGFLSPRGKYAIIPRQITQIEGGFLKGIELYTTKQTNLFNESKSTENNGIDDELAMSSTTLSRHTGQGTDQKEKPSATSSDTFQSTTEQDNLQHILEKIKYTKSQTSDPFQNTSDPDNLQNILEKIQHANLPVVTEPPRQELQNKPSRVQVIIVTQKRSGSSFVGELFNSNPDVFYVYEPLFLPMDNVLKHTLKNDQFPRIAKDIWNHTLRCNFSTDYPPSQSWLMRGDGVFDSCKSITAIKTSSLLCPVKQIPDMNIGPVVSNICHNLPYTVLKTIRVQNILQLKPFVEDLGLNVKIIHLVRDPRAVINSRWNLNENNGDLIRRKGPNADEVLDLCDHMQRNLAYGSNPPEWLKDRYIQVRFEDIAEDPIEETKQIYEKLGMPLQENVLSWIKENTHGSAKHQNKSDPFSRTRDSKRVIDAWRNKLSSDSINKIKITCRKVMSDLSYQRSSLSSEQELQKKNGPLLRDPSYQVISNNPTKSLRVQVIIVTQKRSGSSFVGELFNSNPDVFYVYEPLYLPMDHVLNNKLKNDQFPRIAEDIWNHTLRCNFSTGYPPSQSWLMRGEGVFDSCKSIAAIKSSSLLCPVKQIPDVNIGPVVSNICHDHPFTVLKTIRVQNILQLKPFVEDPGLNVKIIHLVRDPRAVINSRWKLNEKNKDLIRRKGPDADEVLDLCDHMQRNLAYGSDPPEWLKHRYIRVRFEDIAEDPIEETKQIYEKLGMPLHDNVLSWIEQNTHGNNKHQNKSFDPFSRTRDSKRVIDAWRNKLSSDLINKIEITCREVMRDLSYIRESLFDDISDV